MPCQTYASNLCIYGDFCDFQTGGLGRNYPFVKKRATGYSLLFFIIAWRIFFSDARFSRYNAKFWRTIFVGPRASKSADEI